MSPHVLYAPRGMRVASKTKASCPPLHTHLKLCLVANAQCLFLITHDGATVALRDIILLKMLLRSCAAPGRADEAGEADAKLRAWPGPVHQLSEREWVSLLGWLAGCGQPLRGSVPCAILCSTHHCGGSPQLIMEPWS